MQAGERVQYIIICTDCVLFFLGFETVLLPPYVRCVVVHFAGPVITLSYFFPILFSTLPALPPTLELCRFFLIRYGVVISLHLSPPTR